MTKSSYKAHVLILPYPAQGHINPMIQFSKRLLSKQIKPTLVTTIFAHNSMQANAISITSKINIDTISDGYDAGGRAAAKSIEEYVKSFKESGSRTLGDLITRLGNIDAIVYDPFLPWALDVAKRFGLVGVIFFTQSCAVNSVYYHVKKGVVGLPLEEGRVVSLPSLPPLEPCEMPSFIFESESYPGYRYLLLNQFSNVDEADLVLFNSFYELEKETVEWMAKLWSARTIGPTVPSFYLDNRLPSDKDYGFNLFNSNDEACLNWLNQRPATSVIYVSFGSLAALNQDQMEELAWGLKQTNHYFLWVVRESEETKLPNNFKEDVSEKGLLVNWCPQLEVLANESIGCFVTHCGFNSTLEAISLGVPMVVMPQWTDQSTNAKYVEDVWGVGIRARPDEKGIVRRKVVEMCIREVMEGAKGKEIKKNVIKWKDLAREAVSEGGSSDKNIDDFVEKIVAF
ncbi:hypothetical protein UlMin_032003 [Ulmus minor]